MWKRVSATVPSSRCRGSSRIPCGHAVQSSTAQADWTLVLLEPPPIRHGYREQASPCLLKALISKQSSSDGVLPTSSHVQNFNSLSIFFFATKSLCCVSAAF